MIFRGVPLTAASLGGGIAASLSVFALLGVKAVDGGVYSWDRFLFRHLYSGNSVWPKGDTPGRDNDLLQAALPVLYRGADARLLLLLASAVVAALLLLDLLPAAVFYVAAIAVAASSPMMKDVFDRQSPFPVPGEPAFPSGHAMASMAIAAGLVALLARTRWCWPAVGLALMYVVGVAVAVVADGGHWPSDVVAGWSLSLAWVLALTVLVPDPLRNRRDESRDAFVESPPNPYVRS